MLGSNVIDYFHLLALNILVQHGSIESKKLFVLHVDQVAEHA